MGIEQKRIIFATKNMGKIREIKDALKDTDFEVLSLNDIDDTIEIVEDGESFEENAIIKARTIMKLTNTMVLADDSGLEVDYLDKAPGIYSARYLGEDTPQEIKNQHIIKCLECVEDSLRTARFVCCMACANTDGTVFTVRGTIEGSIAKECSGDNGFGYDPIFFVPMYQKTMAQLSLLEKNEISHRAKALSLMKDKLTELQLV